MENPETRLGIVIFVNNGLGSEVRRKITFPLFSSKRGHNIQTQWLYVRASILDASESYR